MGERSRESRVGGLNLGSPKKKMRKAQKLSSPPYIPPTAVGETDNAAMIALFLDMSSLLHAMEEYMAQCEQANHDQARGMIQ